MFQHNLFEKSPGVAVFVEWGVGFCFRSFDLGLKLTSQCCNSFCKKGANLFINRVEGSTPLPVLKYGFDNPFERLAFRPCDLKDKQRVRLGVGLPNSVVLNLGVNPFNAACS